MTISVDGLSGKEHKKILFVFPSSNENVRADLSSLAHAGMLAAAYTTIALPPCRRLFSVLPRSLREAWQHRVFNESQYIKSFPARRVVHQAARRLRFSALTRHEVGWASVDAVSKDLDRRVSRLIRGGRIRASAVYAYEDVALYSFEAAAEVGMRRIYELPIGYWRTGHRLMTEERERHPEWAATIDTLRDSATKRERKDAELSAADHIIVPSDFVRDTLRESSGITGTVDVIQYGAPTPTSGALRSPNADKIRLLYVGHLTQRKGLSYLFEAMRRLEDVASLTLVGAKPNVECPVLDAELRRHTWLGTVPHQRVLEIMRGHDVLVFASLFEGFALVILEAMAQGLPVITTYNSGASRAVVDGKNGFIVPIRDSEAIVERVSELVGDRDRLAAMSTAALCKAGEMSWAAREQTLIRTLCGRLDASVDSGAV
jgi:glycosyltransferase involved in cell wall biosynthesis